MKRLKIVTIFVVAFLLMPEQNFGAKIQNRDDSDGQEYGSSKLRRVKRGAAVSSFSNSKICHFKIESDSQPLCKCYCVILIQLAHL